MKILPIIQTYEPDKKYLRRLLSRHPFESKMFLKPVFQIDVLKEGLSPKYVALLKSAKPQLISYHQHDYSKSPGDNICDVGMDALEAALSIHADLYMFIEGDTIISNKINSFVRDLVIPKNMGLLTLYLPGNGYTSNRRGIYPIYRFQGESFYGIQCVLFPRKIVQRLVADRRVLNTIPGFNDMRWKVYLLKAKHDFYASHKSYAQHIGFDKNHKAPSPPHTTNEWVGD
jgi:hypothetical protein